LRRRTNYSEFLNTLKELTDLPLGAFAKACGKKSTNMSAYLSDPKHPSKNTASSAVRHLRESPYTRFMEESALTIPVPAIRMLEHFAVEHEVEWARGARAILRL
jgi:hypothetical protein